MSAFAYRVADLLARTLPARATDTLAALIAHAAWFARVPACRHDGDEIEALFERRREAFGVRRRPETAMFASVAAGLRRGDWIALMADRGARSTPGAPSVCAWAAALARRTGASVPPVVLVREEEGGHALCVERPLSAESGRDGAFREAMREWLKRWPGQWAGFEALPEGLV